MVIHKQIPKPATTRVITRWIKLDRPVITNVAIRDGQVILTWTGVGPFHIYRYLANGGGRLTTSPIGANTYKDQTAPRKSPIRYEVRAIKDGMESDPAISTVTVD